MTDKDDIKREPVPSSLEVKELVEGIQSGESRKLQENFKPYIERACVHTTSFIRNTLEPELKEFLFPGLEMGKILEYDFSKVNIDIYVLNNEDNEKFNKKMGYDSDVAATAFTRRDSKGYSDNEKPVIVSGFVPYVRREDLTEEENVILAQMYIIYSFNHELLHVLGLNTSKIPFALTEGLVDLLAQTITKRDDYFSKYPHLHKYLPVAYGSATVGVSILVNTLVKNDVSIDTIIEALGKGEAESLSTVIKKISQIYGEEFALNLARVAEEVPQKLKEYIQSATLKHDNRDNR